MFSFDRRSVRRIAAIALLAAAMAAGAADRAQAADVMKFGIDANGVALARAGGLSINYGTIWAGAWTQKYGWASIETQLQAAAAANVTPVIQWWYWGDDISPACVENGCTDRYHGVFKTKAQWYQMSEELAALLVRTIGTREAIVIVETEFNKNGIEDYEPFDGYLAEHAAIFRRAGNIKTVVGFGGWGQSQWPRFDRAAAASDYVGVQQLRSSVRDAAIYLQSMTALINDANYLKAAFAKPALVTEIGWSSYPSATYELLQEMLAAELFRRMNELRNAGVQGILYRMLVDDPTFNTANYHGEAERYWGLLRADLTPKPAFVRFLEGMRALARVPQNLRATVAGNSVRFDWDAPTEATGVTGYILEAGSSPGAANFGSVALTTRSFSVPAVPNGVYYVRVRSIVNGIASEASNEVTAVVPQSTTCQAPPPAPSLTASVTGGLVTLAWTTPAAPVTGYRLDAGSAPGLANIASISLPATTTSLVTSAPGGTYFVRLAALNDCGSSAASNEVTLTVR